MRGEEEEYYEVKQEVRRVGLKERRLFVERVIRRVKNQLYEDLRKRDKKRLILGDYEKFLEIVGVSLEYGKGILKKDEEMEGV